MGVPRQADLHRPVLEIVAGTEGTITHRQIMNAIVDRFDLSTEDQGERTVSGAFRLNTNVSYAEQYLKNAGLLTRTARATWSITSEGRSFLDQHQGPISVAQIKQLSDEVSPLAVSNRRSVDLRVHTPTSDLGDSRVSDEGPLELMEHGFHQFERDLVQELLDSLSKVSPDHFEQLVVDLLGTMGYGEGQVVGRSGDGGIDGIIDQDALGLEKVYVQAKRWGNQVGEPEIRNFSGSLDPYGATKGVFITTSTFSAPARQTAQTISAGSKFIRLVDGNELAQLMIRHGVGVVTEYTYEIKKLDENYFADEV